MTFHRSASGIRNFALFHGANCTIYIEGKRTNEIKQNVLSKYKTFDELFYSSILSKAIPDIKFIVKPVGSKKDVLEYAHKISIENIKNSFVIIDRDHEGILSSIINTSKVIRTYGYSWENDFWTKKLCLTILNELTSNAKDTENISLYARYENTLSRLARISKIDIITKLHGVKYIPNTDTSVGLNLESSATYGVSVSCLRRQKKISKTQIRQISICPISKNLSNSLRNLEKTKLIRGHLWEHACIHLISNSYKTETGEKSLPNSIVKRIGFSRFADNPEKMFEEQIYTYYSEVLRAAAIAAIR